MTSVPLVTLIVLQSSLAAAGINNHNSSSECEREFANTQLGSVLTQLPLDMTYSRCVGVVHIKELQRAFHSTQVRNGVALYNLNKIESVLRDEIVAMQTACLVEEWQVHLHTRILARAVGHDGISRCLHLTE